MYSIILNHRQFPDNIINIIHAYHDKMEHNYQQIIIDEDEDRTKEFRVKHE